MCLLWLPSGGGGLHPLHKSQPHPLSQGLPEARTDTHLTALPTHTQKSRHSHSCVMSKGQRFLSPAFSEMEKKKEFTLLMRRGVWFRGWRVVLSKGWCFLSLIFTPLHACCVSTPGATGLFPCSSSRFALASSVILLPSAPLYVFFQFVSIELVCNNQFVLFSNSPEPALQLL